MELFEKLGIDWRLLIAQLVNFAILFTALTFLLYKPLLAMLDKRRKKIADSLENAERISEELSRATSESERLISEARKEAGRLTSEALSQAETARAAAMEKTRNDVAAIVASGKAQLAAERDTMTLEVRKAAAELIAAAMEKVIDEKMTATKDKNLIQKVLDNA